MNRFSHLAQQNEATHRYGISRELPSTSQADVMHVKQEMPDSVEECRVPPLPTNDDYFEMR